MSDDDFDDLLFIAAVCIPMLIGLLLEAWEVFRDDTE